MGGGDHSIENNQYQQIDIFNSLKGLVSNFWCYSNWIGDIFNRVPPKYIAHRRGDNRNFISIFTAEKDFIVRLNGDNTHILTDDSKDEKTQELIITKINAVRITRNGE